MSREEELIRSTTRAIASTVREVPPLQLEPDPGELGAPAQAPRRGPGGPRRRWWTWGAPLTAAAMVVALAISLVILKDGPNGSAVRKEPTASTAGPGGAPRYYTALQDVPVKTKTPTAQIGSAQWGVVVGDSVTGKALATFAPPAHTTFQSVTAAADDRTFVVFAVTSSTGSFLPGMKEGIPVANSVATLTGSWYELRLAPGTAHPASLTGCPSSRGHGPTAAATPTPRPGRSSPRRCPSPARNSPWPTTPTFPRSRTTPRTGMR